jgi:hypothetical protein
MNDQALKTIEPPAPPAELTPTTMLSIAVQQGADLDKLEKLMELGRTWKADLAREAYFKAISKFRKEAVEIVKSRRVHYQTSKGPTDYLHADLADVVNAAVPALSKHGLSHSWKTSQGVEGLVTVTCVLSHQLGHSEETSLFATPDTSGSKNAIQAIGSTITYLERYTFLAITGLAAKGQDQDGIQPQVEVELISEEQVLNLEALITEVRADRDAVLRVCQLDALEMMPVTMYQGAIKRLESRREE